MAKYRLRSETDNWGGVLNLTLGSSMTTEECLEIVKKLDDISQNRFYTINVYDINTNRYLGDCEMVTQKDGWILINDYIGVTYSLHVYRYTFNSGGVYTRNHHTQDLKTQGILSRLNAIEQKLNEITQQSNE